MKKKGKKIFNEFEKPNELEEKNITNYIPEERVMAFISALKSFFDQIEQLSQEIETREADKNWNIPIDFRLILEFMRALFRLNSYDIERILINPENSLLLQFLEHFTDNVYLSNEEWCNRKDLFSKYQTQIEELAWKIKDQYHELIWDSYIGSYIDYCKFTGTSSGPNVENLLEHINFTRFYPDQILEWNNKYPDDVMLKVFIYMKLDMIPSIPQLNYKLNKRIRFKNNWIRATGIALGFYHSSPKIDKLYRFKRALKENELNKIIEKNAELLMKEGISDPIILIGDSTSCLARKDDPDAPDIKGERQTVSRTHKYQAVVDSNGIPLIFIGRPGTENDKKGFKNLKESILKVKNLADKYDKKINYVILDAGYFSNEIIQFIKDELGCIPIININPTNSERLDKIKANFENIKQLWREIDKTSSKELSVIEELEHEVLTEKKELNSRLKKTGREGTEFEKLVANLFLDIGIEHYLIIYKERSIVEGLFRMMKACYFLLGKPNRNLPIKGKKAVEIHGFLIIIAMQYLALFNYKLLNKDLELLRSLSYVKLSELVIYY